MDESTADTFANRDEPLPLLTVTDDDVDPESSDTDSSRVSRASRMKRRLSASHIRDKAQQLHAVTSEKAAHSPTGKASIQDRLFNKLLEQVIPTEDYDEAADDSKVDRRSSKYVSRPAFSLTTMSNNFRRFNARIGIVFVFQNRLIGLFTWRTATHTLSFLAVYTFVCLDPYLLIVLPLTVALLFIMVPAVIARHPPPPPTKSSSANPDQFTTYSYSGPPIAPARTIRPAAETSKDFFRNMRDLQNSMADFSNLHDLLVQHIAPATNFADEVYSSMIFLYLSMMTCVLFISAQLLPIRGVLLVGGWFAVVSGHPRAQKWLVKQQKRVERKAAKYSDSLQPSNAASSTGKPPIFFGLPIPNNPTTRAVQNTLTSLSEITLSTAPETAEVEVFELQHRALLPPGGSSSSSIYSPRDSASAAEWQAHLYTPTPYDPLSPGRISGSRPKGTRFFEDVQPPQGWTWHTPKWELDLEAGEWVADRLIVGVEFDVMHTAALQGNRRDSLSADFGGWVWDLAPPSTDTKSGLERDEEVWLAYGDYSFGEHGSKEEKEKAKQRLKKTRKDKASLGEKDWEEQIKFGSRGRTGEWRRRRWVRVVRRKHLAGNENAG